MKKLLLALFLIIPAISFSQAKQGTLKYLDEKKGFKNIVLGADISTISNQVIKKDEKVESYTMYGVTDTSLFRVSGEDIIEKITVGVFQDKIALIFIDVKKHYGDEMYSVFKEAYGKGFKSNPYIDRYQWKGKEVFLVLDMSAYKNDTITFLNLPLNEEVKKYEKNKSQKAKDDI